MHQGITGTKIQKKKKILGFKKSELLVGKNIKAGIKVTSTADIISLSAVSESAESLPEGLWHSLSITL